MNEILQPYMTGDLEDYQDFLARPECTIEDRKDALVLIAAQNWDECLEICINRNDPLLKSKYGAQAWLTMAGNGYTDCWMQMIPLFYQNSTEQTIWKEALTMCVADSAEGNHWDTYALTKTLQGFVEHNIRGDSAEMALISMRIELLHGMDSGSSDQSIADAFAYKHIAPLVKNPDAPLHQTIEFNFGSDPSLID